VSSRADEQLRHARSSRVVLIPRRWYHACDDAFGVAQATVAKTPGAPGRTRSSRSIHRAGKAGMSRPSLWFCRVLFCCTRAMGAASSRPSLRPLRFRGRNDRQDSDAKAGARMRYHALSTSLRAQRSNPDCFLGDSLDCFGASRLAMTAHSYSRRPGQAAATRKRCPRRRSGTQTRRPELSRILVDHRAPTTSDGGYGSWRSPG